LPDGACVVRGGVMTRKLLARSAERSAREGGSYAISVWADAGLDANAIARAARDQGEGYLPHRDMQTSSAGALRSLGYELMQTGPTGHYSLTFPARPTDEELDELMAAFDAPRPNPVAR
jgi:hypothetical protein